MTAANASHRKAAAWMVGWLTAMVVMAVAGREATRTLHVFQVMELRSLLGFVLLWPLLHASGGLKAMRTRRLGQQVARNVVHYGAQFGWFFALTLIPIAQVVAIEFTMPIWTALLAVSFLGERLGPARIGAVILGVVGVAVIVRPGLEHVDRGQLIALGAAVGFAISMILVKSLTTTESTVAIIFWMLVVQSVIGIVPAVVVWRTPAAAVWPWIFVIALCGTYSHFCMTQALRHAEATMIVPMDFLRVPLTALAGWLVYSERIDVYTVGGAALILFANLLNLRRPEPTPKGPPMATNA
ncbi:MAG TPA: DMT family transporter [Caldimonas sp.]|nr:DMT family transporter [Caldimonas sp.]HEX4233588.1 DMT family transporter [Caldimonas sp.]